jgi:hypothetical protein
MCRHQLIPFTTLHKPPQRIERREKPGEMRKISVAHPNGSSDALRFLSVIRAVDVAHLDELLRIDIGGECLDVAVGEENVEAFGVRTGAARWNESREAVFQLVDRDVARFEPVDVRVGDLDQQDRAV